MKLSLFKVSGSNLDGVYTGPHLARLTRLSESDLKYYSENNKRLDRSIKVSYIHLTNSEATSAVIKKGRGLVKEFSNIYEIYLGHVSVDIDRLVDAIRNGTKYLGYSWTLVTE